MVENIEFDLTTLGFNVQNTLVPSRTLYRVPTVSQGSFEESQATRQKH